MSQQLRLPDGRNLDYAIGGVPEGFPLIWIHGTPGAFTPIPALSEGCKQHNLALITYSRPGYGGSSRRRGRQVVDEVDDVQLLMKHLGYHECIIGGWSGGGPHALACAARLEGCRACIVVAGVAPYDAEGLDWLEGQGQDNIDETEAALKGEDAAHEHCDAQRPTLLDMTPVQITKELSSILPDADKKAVVENKDVGEHITASFREALKVSVDGWVDDNLAFVSPWGFDVAEVKVPTFLYQGTLDLMVPFGHGKWLSTHIPEQFLTAHLEDGEGHISIFLGRINDMFDEAKAAIQIK